MSRIHVLADQVANQIAAGEVVERPASVIKELVENSIDAGADRIEVEFKSGGKNFMRVEDNGCGMGSDDALLCLERHATSKIRETKDLDALGSMGFRGEAVPSIASVSRFELQTREKEANSGTEILVDGGKLIHNRECGMPTGTRIVVSQLFKTVPARRKFLKSDATETAHIVHQTRLHALAYPEIAFTLLEDGREIFRATKSGELKQRIAEIFGRSMVKNLIPLEAEEGKLALRGLIGKPGFSKSSRHEMLVFVNNRPVENRTLAYALVESYYGHIPKGRYPVAFLFLDMPPSLVDVNVHPAKREVRFRNEAQVRGFAVRSILQSLSRALESTGRAAPFDKSQSRPREEPSTRARVMNRSGSADPKAGAASSASVHADRASKPLRDKAASTNPTRTSPAASEKREAPCAETPAPPESGAETAEPKGSEPARNWNFIGWAQRDLAIFETESGIILLDTRAASRRIWYERLLISLATQKNESQSLLLPVPCEFDPVASAVVEDNLSDIQAFGFELSPFGRNFYRIEGIPTWLEESEAEAFLREIVATLRKESGTEAKRLQAREAIARRGAAKAARSHRGRDAEEVNTLVHQLFEAKNPLADVDGRPAYIEISRGEIDRRFHRQTAKPDELF